VIHKLALEASVEAARSAELLQQDPSLESTKIITSKLAGGFKFESMPKEN
jgi:hypothetical protein